MITVELEDDDDDDEYGEFCKPAVTNFSRITFHHWKFWAHLTPECIEGEYVPFRAEVRQTDGSGVNH